MYRATRELFFLKDAVRVVLLFVLLVSGTCPVGFAGEIQPINGGPVLAGQPAIPEKDYFRGPLKVTTLNTAHGRKTSFSQIFLSRETIHQNLVDIGLVIRKTEPDIVALQETDSPSWWSGNFDHVALLAGKADLPWHSLSAYMDNWGLQYGAAILARQPYLESRAHRFEDSWGTPAKGFLLTRFGWYPEGPTAGKPVFVDVVSLHLDFSLEATRAHQIDQLQSVLAGRNNHLIIMGDFNSYWEAEDSVVRKLVRQSGLQVYRPEATDLATFWSKRLDWILISSQLKFISYRILPTVLSDHMAVIAQIGMKPQM
jgi:endonuclease/exonuclease/phosphatase family metal-dependent hydrolase